MLPDREKLPSRAAFLGALGGATLASAIVYKNQLLSHVDSAIRLVELKHSEDITDTTNFGKPITYTNKEIVIQKNPTNVLAQLIPLKNFGPKIVVQIRPQRFAPYMTFLPPNEFVPISIIGGGIYGKDKDKPNDNSGQLRVTGSDKFLGVWAQLINPVTGEPFPPPKGSDGTGLYITEYQFRAIKK